MPNARFGYIITGNERKIVEWTVIHLYHFKFVLTEADYLNFNRYHMRFSPVGKKRRLIFQLMVPVILLLFFLASLFNADNNGSLLITAIIYAVFSALWLLILNPLQNLGLKINLKSLKKSGKLPFEKEIDMDFEDEYIHQTMPDSEIKTNYSKIERIAVTEQSIYLYVSVVSAFIVPLSVFQSQAEKLDFLEFLRKKTNLPVSGIL